ncbi:Fic family protein [Candidatus Nomurabacteria bacterium]|nr:Fic family protein [Candidatus Nomurabacteria bacterium]
MNSNDKRIEKLPKEVINLVAQIDELKGRWSGKTNLNPQILGTLKRSTLITSTGSSTRIEGSEMSDTDVEEYIDNLKIQKFSERDTQEVQGYYETLEFIFDNHKSIDFSENTIKYLHAQLLQYSSKDVWHKGEYKNLENKVEMTDVEGNILAVIFETTPAYLTPKEMQELVDWYTEALHENKYHPLLIISNFIVSFLKIHPFLDGNGRMSRLLTNYLLLSRGYEYTPYVSHEKLVEQSKSNYYLALRRSQATFDTEDDSINDWTVYFLGLLLEQAQQAIKLVENENLEKTLSPQQIKVWRYLQTVEEAMPGEIADKTGVARATVSQALNRLLDIKKVERIGQGRTTRYKKK